MPSPTRRYYRGHDLVAMRDVANSQTRYYHFDHQGTTQCLTDETGVVTDRFASDAWGVPVKRTGNSINRNWFIGRRGLMQNPATNRSALLMPTNEYAANLGRTLSARSGLMKHQIYNLSPALLPLQISLIVRFNQANRPVLKTPCGDYSSPKTRQSITAPCGGKKELIKLRCPPLPACGINLDEPRPCEEVGTLFQVQALSNPLRTLQSRGVTVTLGYNDLPNHDLASECSCKAGVQWTQIINTNYPIQGKPDTWIADDLAGSKDCIFRNFTHGANKVPFPVPPYKYWLEDNPSREVRALTEKFLGKSPNAWSFCAISCLVCLNWNNSGKNWVMLESCVQWGFVDEIIAQFIPQDWLPQFNPCPTAPVGASGEGALRQVLTVANCPNNPQKQGWLISNCPPS